MISPNFVFIFSVLFSSSVGKPQWDIGSADGFHFMHYSESEQHTTSDIDIGESLVVWVGAPASGPRVNGKMGEMALPTAWGAFVDILFVRQVELPNNTMLCTEMYANKLFQFMESKNFLYATIYFAGVWHAGGNCIPTFVKYFHKKSSTKKVKESHKEIIYQVGGALLIDGPQTPSAMFFTHGSLETGNHETDYSINRASQNIVCNARLNSMQLVLNDVRFEYTQLKNENNDEQDSTSNLANSQTEYALHQIDVPGVGCFHLSDINNGTSSSSSSTCSTSFLKSPNRFQETKPMIGMLNDSHNERFCPINPHLTTSQSTSNLDTSLKDLYDLIQFPIGRFFLVSTLQSHHRITCSFYIGIFEAEAMEIMTINKDGNSQHFKFNHQELETLWPMGDHSPLGEFQESSEYAKKETVSTITTRTNKLLWAHVSVVTPWTRRAALRFLSIIKGDVSELDFFVS